MQMTLYELVKYTVVGFSIVFLALFIIILVIYAFLAFDARWEDREKKQSEARDVKLQNIDDTTLVLISASVAAVIKSAVIIKRIRRLPRIARTGGSWAEAGRITLLGSHNITKRD